MSHIINIILHSEDSINMSIDIILIMLLLPSIITLLNFITYKLTLSKKISSFKGFQDTFLIAIMLSSAVSLIMLTTGPVIATAFALVVIFATLKVLNPNKSMYPLFFILVAIVSGITCGVGDYLLSICFGVFTCLLIAITNLVFTDYTSKTAHPVQWSSPQLGDQSVDDLDTPEPAEKSKDQSVDDLDTPEPPPQK